MSKMNVLKKCLSSIAHASTSKMGDIIIFTSVAGWMASSAAQIFGISRNKNYTNEQKKYMINQETFDALTNIGLYFGITKSCTLLSSKLVSSTKIAPRSVLSFMNKKGLLKNRGNFDFDITKNIDFQHSKGLKSKYDAFKCFADATAATIGGIISSNIVTPLVRNSIAAHRQNKYKNNIGEINKSGVENKNNIAPQKNIYNNYRGTALRI